MADDSLTPSRIDAIHSDAIRSKSAASEGINKYSIMQESTEEQFTEWSELSAFNPLAMARRFETLEIKTRKKGKEEEAEKTEKEEKKILEVQKTQEVSEQYQKKNPEILARSLLLLRSRISTRDTKEEILKKVIELYPDYSLADEALDFLLQTSDGELASLVQQAKDDLNHLYGREVRAGKNITATAQEFSKEGLGNPTALRDLYRDITGNPRDAGTLFSELTSNFDFEKMNTVIRFILHSLGSDLKSKGPSISRAELHRLMTESRSMQAILGVYRFFKTRMSLIESAFQREGLSLSARLNFETLAKTFMKFLQERYPTADKVIQLGYQLGLSEEEIGAIIIFTQMRDAIRQIAPKLFRSEQHRQDVFLSFIEAIEELDEELEKEEEEKEEDSKEDEN